MVIRLDRDEARRIAVRAQLLDAARPTELVDAVRQLTFLRLEPTAAVAPAADLVLWSRFGDAYDPAGAPGASTPPHRITPSTGARHCSPSTV